MSNAEFQNLYSAAHKAGMEAVRNLTVVPMVVGEETYPFSGVIDESKQTYFVEDGPCGFAWVNVKPGNSRFANWLKKMGFARRDSYYGGVTIWISDFNQSIQKKETYASAFSKVLSDAGIKSYWASRMD